MVEQHISSERQQDPEVGKIRPGATLADLVKERGYGGELSYFVDQLVDEWNAKVLPEVIAEEKKPLLKLPRNESGVPQFNVDRVCLPDANVQILGVRHGINLFKRTKTSYAKAVKAYIKDLKNTKWFTEQGLDKWCDIEDVASGFQDLAEFLKIAPNDLLTLNGISSCKSEELEKRSRKRFLKYFLFGSDRFPLREVDIDNITTLPQPLDIEASLVMSGKDMRGRNVVTDRSKMMADHLREEIDKLKGTIGKIPEIGFLCGDAHKRQIGYFLTHPDYDPRSSITTARSAISKNIRDRYPRSLRGSLVENY